MNESSNPDDILPAKEMVEIPVQPNYWLWIAVVVVVLVAAWLLCRWWQRRSNPGFSAGKLALEKLAKSEFLVGEGSPEPLVNQVSEIVREYIEKRFHISALSKSTEEFLRQLHVDSIGEIAAHRESLGSFLSACDKVKFARGEMAREDRKSLLETARQFISSSSSIDGKEVTT